MFESKFRFTSEERAAEIAALVKNGQSEAEARAFVVAREAEVNARLGLAAEENRGEGSVRVPIKHEGRTGVSPDILRVREEQTAREVEAALEEIRRQIEGAEEPHIEFDPQEAPGPGDDIRRRKEEQTLERAGVDPRLADEGLPRRRDAA